MLSIGGGMIIHQLRIMWKSLNAMRYKVIKIEGIYKIYSDRIYWNLETEVETLEKAEKYIFGLSKPKQPEKVAYYYNA